MEAEQKLPDVIRKGYFRQFAAIVLLVVVVVAGFSVYAEGQVSAELTRDVHSEMETVADLEAEEIRLWVEENERTVRMLSEFGEFSDSSPEAIRGQLDHEAEQLPETVTAIHYVDLTSRTVEFSTARDREGESLPELEWTHGSLSFDEASDVAVSEGYMSDGSERIAFVSPIEGSDTAIVLVLDPTERAEAFRDPIDGGYTQVVAADGTIELAENQSEALTAYRDGGSATVLQTAQDSASAGVIERDETGEVVAYAPIEGTDWVVLSHAPQENAYALRSEVRNDLLIIIGLALAGFLFFGATIGRTTVRELRSLAANAQALAGGDQVEIDDATRIDELGQMRSAFGEVSDYVETTTLQASAVADQNFQADVLDEDVPGELGDALDRMRHDLEEFITELEQAKENARSSQEKAETLAKELNDQAEQFSNVMAEAAAGDFTRRLDTDIDNDSMREIAEAFNTMLSQLEATVVEVRDIASEVDDVSDEISAGAEEVQNASQEVSESVQEIAAGSDQQNENIQQAANEMTDLSATIEEIASSSDEVAGKSRQAAELGAEGSTYATEAVTEMDEIEQQAEETVSEVEKLDDEMERIGEIVDLIDEIAEQTNMLALNASIEAARAGEAGEGFGVVADEIKSLAQETGQATQEIEQLISEVQNSTTRAVGDMREMGERVESGRETVERAATTLENITEQVGEANDGVQSINDATDEQAASTEEVVAMVDEVGTISEQTSDEAEQVAAAAEEQTASISEVTDNIVSLSGRATDLRELTDEFEVRADVGGLSASDTGSVSEETASSDDD